MMNDECCYTGTPGYGDMPTSSFFNQEDLANTWTNVPAAGTATIGIPLSGAAGLKDSIQ